MGNIVIYWVKVGDLSLKVQADPYFEVKRQEDKIFLSIKGDRINVIEVPIEVSKK